MRRVASAIALFALLFGAPAWAVNVSSLVYDAAEDQLILTIAYRGTHANHNFSVQWDECKRLDDQRSQILGLLVDSAPDDLARKDFRTQIEVDLASFPCRPSKVTIRTSAGLFTSVDIPPQKKALPPTADARNAP